MVRGWVELEQVDHVDEKDLQVGKLLAKQLRCRKGLLGRYITGRSHDQVRLPILVVARPVPNADALGAMLDRGFHIQILKMQLLVGNDHVDIVLAPQAVIGYGQQTIDVGWKVNARDSSALIEHNVQESGLLVRKSVVVFPPNRRSDQQLQ